jgi:hypothetical protein
VRHGDQRTIGNDRNFFVNSNMVVSEHFGTSGAKDAAAPTRIPKEPSQRILVVEDDAAIRRFSAQVLARSGYRADASEDGAAAPGGSLVLNRILSSGRSDARDQVPSISLNTQAFGATRACLIHVTKAGNSTGP